MKLGLMFAQSGPFKARPAVLTGLACRLFWSDVFAAGDELRPGPGCDYDQPHADELAAQISGFCLVLPPPHHLHPHPVVVRTLFHSFAVGVACCVAFQTLNATSNP